MLDIEDVLYLVLSKEKLFKLKTTSKWFDRRDVIKPEGKHLDVRHLAYDRDVGDIASPKIEVLHHEDVLASTLLPNNLRR